MWITAMDYGLSECSNTVSSWQENERLRCGKINKRKKKKPVEADRSRTCNLEINPDSWSHTRCHCATAPLLDGLSQRTLVAGGALSRQFEKRYSLIKSKPYIHETVSSSIRNRLLFVLNNTCLVCSFLNFWESNMPAHVSDIPDETVPA